MYDFIKKITKFFRPPIIGADTIEEDRQRIIAAEVCYFFIYFLFLSGYFVSKKIDLFQITILTLQKNFYGGTLEKALKDSKTIVLNMNAIIPK